MGSDGLQQEKIELEQESKSFPRRPIFVYVAWGCEARVRIFKLDF